MPLTAPQTLSYNGVTFPVFQEVFASNRFVSDSSERTVTHTVLTLRVKAKIASGATQNATLAAMRSALERPGGELSYTGMAFGGLSINTAGGKRDLEWGPKPRMLTWKPLGRDQAAEIEWQVEVALIGCAGAPDRNAVMEANYEVTFSVDKSGYTTRTITGRVKIPMTRRGVNNPVIPDSAENYVDDYIPKPLPGFDRASSRALNESKNECRYTITDTERAGNALPEGIVSATGSHSSSSVKGPVFKQWTSTLNATYEVMKGLPRSLSWEAFKKLLKDRIDAETKVGSTCWPISMTIGEPEIFGPQSGSFSITYMILNEKGNQSFFPLAGLWRPVPGTNWNKWSTSIAKTQGLRGTAGLRHRAADDAIVDLCINQAGNKLVGNAQPIEAKLKPIKDKWAEIKKLLKLQDNPPVGATWLLYECRVVIEEENHMVAHVPLPANPWPGESRLKTPALLNFQHSGRARMVNQQITPPPIVQERASAGYHIRLIGRALRFAYPIPAPDVLRVAGSPVVDANDPELGTYWMQWLAGWSTHPIYAAMWNLRYFVARGAGAAPGEPPIFPHPFGE